MDILERIGELINEATTLSALGVTPQQVKTIYARGTWGSTYAPDAKAKYEKVNSKKAVKDLMKATGTYRPVVVGMTSDNTLFLVRYTDHNNKYYVAKIAADGEVIATWSEKSPQKAISYFTGVREYYISANATVDVQGTDKLNAEPEFNNAEQANRIAKIISKEAEKLFTEYRNKAAAKINARMADGDFTGAHHLLRNWIETGNFSRDTRDSTMRDMLTGRGWNSRDFRDWLGELVNGGSPDSFGYSPAIDRILRSATDAELRKAGAELLREIKEKLEDAIEE
jgi:hypothetical protein